MRIVVGVLLIVAGIVLSLFAMWKYINYLADGDFESGENYLESKDSKRR